MNPARRQNPRRLNSIRTSCWAELSFRKISGPRWQLIYPKWDKFSDPIGPFDFGGGLRLWALPFDLDEPAGGELLYHQMLNLQLKPNPSLAPLIAA